MKAANLKITWCVKRISGLKKESDRRFGNCDDLFQFSRFVVMADRVQVDVQVLKKSSFCSFSEKK